MTYITALAGSFPLLLQLVAADMPLAPVGQVLAVVPLRPPTAPGKELASDQLPRLAGQRTLRPARDLERELRVAYRRQRQMLRSCFLRAAKRGVGQQLKTEIALDLAADGSVRRVSFAPSPPAQLGKCVARWVKRWRFSPGDETQLTVPVLFRAHHL